MATQNPRELVAELLEALRGGLAPFVARELERAEKKGKRNQIRWLQDDPNLRGKKVEEWDAAGLLKVVADGWNDLFNQTLGQEHRNYVFELRNWRNKWAHQEALTLDDAYSVADSVERLLKAVSAPNVGDVEALRLKILELQLSARRPKRPKAAAEPAQLSAFEAKGLPPWRRVVLPHEDVRSGNYRQAEFAADLWQVHEGKGSAEYRDPVEFFRRTYLTAGLRDLLQRAVQRLAGTGGDPVVQLRTNFGGGKTHAMLALYHLFSGEDPARLPGIPEILDSAGVTKLPSVRRAVLVGNRISPGSASVKPDGTEVRTLWGELAWQLGGREGWELIAEDDRNATNPGARLQELFERYGPCLVLVDEWVAYARQLHDEPGLPGGTFDTQFTFAQTLTEAAKTSSKPVLVAISLPQSESAERGRTAETEEVGGVRGQEALRRLSNVIGRVEWTWRPATQEEAFEIVRRRLFEPFSAEGEQARELVAQAFATYYQTNGGELPKECRERSYEERLRAAYPIHPEVFDRLYSDWSTHPRFQRTRGVLRLMAAVVHTLWEREDGSPLILPGTLPLDDRTVQAELTRHLSDNWPPIIDSEIDGPNSLPLRLEQEIPNFGRLAACRRVARTIFLGTAPHTDPAHRGLDIARIKLGSALPGDSLAVYGDAVRHLADNATYLYQDGSRYWFSPQPTVRSIAEGRAEQLRRSPEKVLEEIEKRLRRAAAGQSQNLRIHPCARDGSDVPDDLDARLVVLPPDVRHTKGEESPALIRAKSIWEQRGSAPRIFRNTLVFLAADAARAEELEDAVRHYLAWSSIVDDANTLDLTSSQKRQAEEARERANDTVEQRLRETYCWLLWPHQGEPHDAVAWQEDRLQGGDGLFKRAFLRLLNNGALYSKLGGANLRMELDRVPLWRGDHVEVRQLVEDFARYAYLPRLQEPSVLVRAVQEGVQMLTWATEGFAYAESYDEERQRYRGLQAGAYVELPAEAPPGLVVKPEAAMRQLQADAEQRAASAGEAALAREGGSAQASLFEHRVVEPPVEPAAPPAPRRFYGEVQLDPLAAGRDAGRIGQEVLSHLLGIPGSRVQVTLYIDAEVPDGIPEHVRRIVDENARTLKFRTHSFEVE